LVLVRSGKIGALLEVVTVELEPPSTPTSLVMRDRHRLPEETPTSIALRIHVAETLKKEAREIAGRWEAQARSVALRDSGVSMTTGQENVAVALVESLATALASDGATSKDMVARGFAFGAEAFESGASLHYTLKGLDLLSAMTLYAVEITVANNVTGDITPADAVQVCRRLQQGSSLLTLAAAKGYTHTVTDQRRHQFRHLRHDLKNPLGTIKSVLALMDDETIPLNERSNPRFRAMAKRSIWSLGELIAERLSDAEAVLLTYPFQRVSLRTVACTVCRDLRAEAVARGTTVLVADTKVCAQIDAVGLELMLHELLLAALQESREGDELSVDFGEPGNTYTTVRLQRTPNHPLISERPALERLGAFAVQIGAKLDVGEQLILTYPVQGVLTGMLTELSSYVPVTAAADAPAQSDSGDPCHDIRGTCQRDHGQSSPF
jgi:signal transduction histidine kinase